MSIFEVIMLICFGASWPFSLAKTISIKNPRGKSMIFLGLIVIGYAAGCSHKLIYNFDWVFWLYVLNGMLVMTDMALVIYYRHRIELAEKEGKVEGKC